MDVAAEFAARVAKAASEKSSPPPPPPPAPVVPQTGPPAYLESSQVVTTNGSDPSGTNSISSSEGMSPGSILIPGDALPVSKQQIVVVDESINITHMTPTVSSVAGTPSTWKQGQLPQSSSASIGGKPSDCSGKSNINNQAVSGEKAGLTKLVVEPQVVEFVPSVSAAEVKTPVVTIKDSETTPVVSAQTNAPTVEVVRSSNREPFPALKPSAPLHQSPRRKQSQRPEAACSVPPATPVASIPSVQTTLPSASATSRETTPTTEIKVSKKPAPTEESTPPSPAFPVSQSPKEKRDQDKPHGREREKSSSVSSQGRGEREKSTSSSSSSSQHHGRDREKSSRDKDKASTAPQVDPRDSEKSASKSSTKDAAPVPSPVAPVAPAVDAAPTQTQSELAPPSRLVAAEDTKQQTNGEISTADTTEGEYMLNLMLVCRRNLETECNIQ